MNETQSRRKRPSHAKKRKSPGVMNIVLVVVGLILVTCVFAACGGEFGIMGWIKTTKERNQSRKWELDDREAAIKQAQEPPDGTC